MIIGMLAGLIYLNYFGPLRELLTLTGKTFSEAFLVYFVLFLIPFTIAFFLQLLFFPKPAWLHEKWFWLTLILAPAIFALRTSFNFHQAVVNRIWENDEAVFWLRCFKWIVGMFIVIPALYLLWVAREGRRQTFYGLRPLASAKPYLLMIGCMLPLLALAATQPDFLRMYPRAKIVDALNLHPKFLYYALHELFYSLDFVTIEVFFRGFLVISLTRICGKHCIVPAACFYCCIHFGKPMGEAISSFAGGLLLGIIAWETKTIRGGLLVHIGIAWMMEIAGFLAM